MYKVSSCRNAAVNVCVVFVDESEPRLPGEDLLR